MRDDKERVARLIRAMLSCIGKSSPADVEAILNGTAEFVIVPERNRSTSTKKTTRVAIDADQIASLRTGLLAAESRERGEALLSQAALSRRELEALARTFDMTVRKEDNVERIRARIIATSIGSRLNASAIRGDDPTK